MSNSKTEKPLPRKVKTNLSPAIVARFRGACNELGVPPETKLRELVHRFVIEWEAQKTQWEASAKTRDTP